MGCVCVQEKITASKEVTEAEEMGEEGEEEEDDDDEEGENVEEAQELLDAIKENMEQNGGKAHRCRQKRSSLM